MRRSGHVRCARGSLNSESPNALASTAGRVARAVAQDGRGDDMSARDSITFAAGRPHRLTATIPLTRLFATKPPTASMRARSPGSRALCRVLSSTASGTASTAASTLLASGVPDKRKACASPRLPVQATSREPWAASVTVTAVEPSSHPRSLARWTSCGAVGGHANG